MSSRAELTALLEQTGWIRALAQSLASDVHTAEDLVQDAWVAALEHPPELGRPVRGWLASVLRNRWLDRKRERGRRQERERTAARDEAWPSSHDVVEKASIQRRLVEAVLELDEPYRTTVLLRFFEELPQREIARRMQTSTATVNSRLTRALAKLRERMSRDGGRDSWLPVLVPLLGKPTPAPVTALGALAMKVVIASVVVAGSVLIGLALWTSKAQLEPESAFAAQPAPPLAPTTGAGTIPPAVDETRPPADPRTPLASEPSATAPGDTKIPSAPRTLRGRVLDASGGGLAGIALGLSSPESKSTAASGAGGRFEIVLDVPAESIVSADPRYATVLAGSARVHGETQPTVVVAPRIDLAGFVVDESRAPLADASLELRLPPGFGAEWGFALDYSVPQRWRAVSLDDGRFDLSAVPAVEGASIHANLAGFAPGSAFMPLHPTTSLEIVLARPGESAGLVRGVVLDPLGARVEGARVSAGAEIANSDARGEFALDVRREGTRARLVALKTGLLPATFEPERDSQGAPRWPREVVLQLGGPSGAVSGRIVDADGRPITGAKVWLDDPTPFGRLADARVVAESLLRGDERFWSYEVTRDDGTFTITGLMQRAYRLQAVDPRTLVSVESPPLSAEDSPVELRLPTRDVHERVAGRVVTNAGQPIRGVTVRLYRVTYELEHEGGTDNEVEERELLVTGADGAFEFRDVARSGVNLIVTGDTILGAAAFLEEEADPTRVEIVASLRLHLQVELDPPIDRADELRVFDADGRRVVLSVFRGGGAHASFEMPILEGRSAVLSVEEGASNLALYRGGEEVARLPLSLAPGPTNVVRY